MSDYNRVILSGHLGQEPELKYAQSGQGILRLRLASNEAWRDAQGEKQERTEWSTVVFFGKRAEGLSRHLSKGSKVLIEGKLRTRQWEDRDGDKRYTTEVIADELVFLDPSRGGQRQQSSGQHTERRAPQQQAQGGFPIDDFPVDEFGVDDIPF